MTVVRRGVVTEAPADAAGVLGFAWADAPGVTVAVTDQWTSRGDLPAVGDACVVVDVPGADPAVVVLGAVGGGPVVHPPVNELPAPTGTLDMDGEAIHGLPNIAGPGFLPAVPPTWGSTEPYWSTQPLTAAVSIGLMRSWTRGFMSWIPGGAPASSADNSRVVTAQMFGTLPNIAAYASSPKVSELATKAQLDSAVSPGDIKMGAWTTVPSGWLECNGQAVSRSTYAALFAEIGTTHGAGNGTSTFNVPDLRGRSPMGAGTGTGLTARSNGQKVGSETHTLDISEIPTHPAYNAAGGGWAVTSSTAGPIGGMQGGGQPHANVQPSTVVRFAIRT